MKSPRRTRRKRLGEKALTFHMAVLDLTTPFLEADTHHQGRANMWDKQQPSSNALEEDHDIWDPRGRALGVGAGPIGRAVPTARAPELMNPQMV